MKNIPVSEPVKTNDMDNFILGFPFGMHYSEHIMHDKDNSWQDKKKKKKFKFRTTHKKVIILYYRAKNPQFIIQAPFGVEPVIKEDKVVWKG